jgi:hypothetical protein
MKKKIRKFDTGATRDTDKNKADYEGFLSPLVIKRFGEYMNRHRLQPDGQLRESDNWTKGIPRKQYVKSLIRHLVDVWLINRDFKDKARTQDMEEALCAVMFNSMGLLYEILLKRDVDDIGVQNSIKHS